MMKTRLSLILVSVALGACGSEDPVPATPTWVDDVEPILRGNCFHCHGGSERPAVASRFDVYSLDEDVFGALPSDAVGATVKLDAILLYTKMLESAPLRMPPPPAEPLSDRDMKVLERWGSTGKTRGQRRPNHPPSAHWITRGSAFEVRDGDHEQVLGQITCGVQAGLVLPRSGAWQLPPGSQPPCMLDLTDGQDMVTITLP